MLPVLVLLAAACAGSDAVQPDDVEARRLRNVASVSISPDAPSINAGGGVQLSATLRNAEGTILTGRTVTWTTSSSEIAGVSSSGLVAGKVPGTARISAANSYRADTVTVTIRAIEVPPVNPPAPVASVSVSPTAPSLLAGATTQLTATLRDSAGNVLAGRTVTWTSNTASRATVNSSGLVSGVAAGSSLVTASSDGRTASVNVTVTAPATPPPPPPAQAPVATVTIAPQSPVLNIGGTVLLAATLRDAAGNVLTGRTVTWSSASISVASVSTISGQVTALLGGTSTVTATSEGRTASTVVTVSTPTAPPPPAAGSNEPAGFVAIVERAFNTKAASGADRGTGSWPLRTGGSEGWDGVESGYSNIAVVSDATSPTGGLNNVMRFAYTQGTVPTGTTYAPGVTQTQGFNSAVHGSLQNRKLYVRFWFKLGSGFQNHSAGMKLMFFRSSEPAGYKFEPIIGVHGQNGAAGLHFNLQGTQDNARGNLMPNTGSGTDAGNLRLNTWYKVEVLLEMNSAYGTPNGVLRGWLNGVQVFNYNDVRYLRDSSTYVWSAVHLASTWGGQGGTINSTWYWYLDHLYVSGAR